LRRLGRVPEGVVGFAQRDVLNADELHLNQD